MQVQFSSLINFFFWFATAEVWEAEGAPELSPACHSPSCKKHSSQPCGLALLQALSLHSSASHECFGRKSAVSAAEQGCCPWPESAPELPGSWRCVVQKSNRIPR